MTTKQKTIISIEGGMAIGKTTLIRKLKEMNLGVEVLYENPDPVVAKVKKLKLDKNILADYRVNQRLFIEDVIERIEKSNSEILLMDYGPEAIECHTLFYPATQGFDWDIETELNVELKLIRQYRSNNIFFLEADEKTLRVRKQSDKSRTRSSFEFYIKHMHPRKKSFFENLDPTEFISAGSLSPDELANLIGKQIKEVPGKSIAPMEAMEKSDELKKKI